MLLCGSIASSSLESCCCPVANLINLIMTVQHSVCAQCSQHCDLVVQAPSRHMTGLEAVTVRTCLRSTYASDCHPVCDDASRPGQLCSSWTWCQIGQQQVCLIAALHTPMVSPHKQNWLYACACSCHSVLLPFWPVLRKVAGNWLCLPDKVSRHCCAASVRVCDYAQRPEDQLSSKRPPSRNSSR